jgi:tRNA-dihydrouridine synthase B
MQSLIRPISIGSIRLEDNLALAPMAGFGNTAMRLITKEVGKPGLVAGEMVAALAAFKGKDARNFRLLTAYDAKEKPLQMQIYGKDPERCAVLARMLVEAGADIVDLNCGCPVRKAQAAGCGLALMRDPPLIGRILTAIRKAVSVPITVKMRLGVSADKINCYEIARIAEDAGADAMFLHCRTGESKLGEPVQLEPLAKFKQLVKVPVYANGGMDDPELARRALSEAGADGIQIGSAACGNPWIFCKVRAALMGQPYSPPSLAERRRLMEQHLNLILALYGEEHGVRVMRKYNGFYLHGLPGVRHFRQSLVRMGSRAEFHAASDAFFTALSEWPDTSGTKSALT